MKRQENAIKENKLRKKMKQKKLPVPKVLLLFDDIIAEPAIRHSKILFDLTIKNRHLHTALFILSQACNAQHSVCRGTRGQFAMVFANRIRNENDRKVLLTEYFSLTTKKEGMELFNKITLPKFSFCAVDCRKQNSRQLTDYCPRRQSCDQFGCAEYPASRKNERPRCSIHSAQRVRRCLPAVDFLSEQMGLGVLWSIGPTA